MKYFKLFIKEHKIKTALSLILLLGQVIGTLLIPALIANVVDKGILQGDITVIKQIGLQMLLVAGISMLISVAGSWATSNLAALFGREMRTKLFAKTQEISLSQFNTIGVSSLITRSTSDITNLQQTLGMVLQLVVPAPIIIVVSIIMTAMINPTIAFIQLVFMVILLILSGILLKKSNKLSHSIQTRLDVINKVLRESITGVRVIRAFGNEKYEQERSGKTYSSYADNMIKLNRLFAISTPFIWIFMGSLMAVILGLGGLFSIQGSMAVGQIAAVAEYAIITITYLMMAVATMTTLPKAQSCLERLEEALNAKPSIKNYDLSPLIRPMSNKSPVIEFKNVTFAYPGGEESVISNLSFTIHAGKTTAVIGSTGSGKSTLADLILRLHDIHSGSIKFKGVDIRELPQETLREKIGSVPQKAFLFSGTIAENLRMGHSGATDAQLWKSLAISQAKDFVQNLPNGLNSRVSQGGTNFSGGQKQRIAIARALVRKADLFIFDDSFSALDVKTDSTLRKSLNENLSEPAKLIIAQRVSSIMDADQILVLNEGILVGTGTHNELLKNCEIYNAIVESQMHKKEA